MPSGLSYNNSLDRSISYINGVLLVFYYYNVFVENSNVDENYADPDQTWWRLIWF